MGQAMDLAEAVAAVAAVVVMALKGTTGATTGIMGETLVMKITEKGVMAKIPGKKRGKRNTVGGSQIQMVVVVLGRIMMTEMDGILTTKMTTLKEMAWRECVAPPDLVDWMGDKVKMLWFGIEWVIEWVISVKMGDFL